MNAPLLLLCFIEILGAQLCGASVDNFTRTQIPDATGQNNDSHSNADSISSTYQTDPTHVSSSMSTPLPPKTVSQDYKSHSTSLGPKSTITTTITTTTTTNPSNMLYRKECLPLLMTVGGLIIVSTILLIATLMLMCKVCQLSSRVKMLSDNSDLISTSEYRMGTAKKSKSSLVTNAKETTVLMADINQIQEDVGNGAAKEEAAKANEDGQTGEEEDKKEVGDTAKSGEASTTPVVENASPSKPQEEATDSESVKARAAPSSKGTEEPKEEV